MKVSNVLERTILLLFSGFFLLSSVGFIDVVDYRSLAGYFGLSDEAQRNNAYYVIVIGSIGIIVIFIATLVDMLAPKKSIESNIARKASRYLGDYMDSLKSNAIKTSFGLLLTFVVQQLFILRGIFSCVKTSIPGGWAEYCGTEKEIILLAAAMILFAFAVLPEKIKRIYEH
jgi:hypothetical protein